MFRFPLNREDHLKKWIEAIGQADLKPTKVDVICSAHFIANDFMVRPGARDVRLNYLAVPSIFLGTPATVPLIASETLASNTSAPHLIAWNSILKPKDHSGIFQPICTLISKESSPTLAMHSQTIKFKNPEENEENCLTVFSLPSKNTTDISAVDDTIRMTLRKKQKIMDNSQYYLKNKEITSTEKQIHRVIKLLKQKVTRKEERIQLLKILVAKLQKKMQEM